MKAVTQLLSSSLHQASLDLRDVSPGEDGVPGCSIYGKKLIQLWLLELGTPLAFPAHDQWICLRCSCSARHSTLLCTGNSAEGKGAAAAAPCLRSGGPAAWSPPPHAPSCTPPHAPSCALRPPAGLASLTHTRMPMPGHAAGSSSGLGEAGGGEPGAGSGGWWKGGGV